MLWNPDTSTVVFSDALVVSGECCGPEAQYPADRFLGQTDGEPTGETQLSPSVFREGAIGLQQRRKESADAGDSHERTVSKDAHATRIATIPSHDKG